MAMWADSCSTARGSSTHSAMDRHPSTVSGGTGRALRAFKSPSFFSAEAREAETFTVTREQMEKMEALAGQLSSLHDQHLRLAAEYDNYRKRTTREKETIYQDAKLDTIAKFLEVYDNLERAASQTGDEDNVHKQGMVMIFNQLRNVLEKMGVTIDDPQGQPFDPARHNAVMHVDDENLGEGIVSQVFQKGFLLGERVIRCATVQVAN